MTAVVGRVWGWVRPVISYRPWGSKAGPDKTMRDKPVAEEQQTRGSWGFLGGLTTWVWGAGQKRQTSEQTTLIEEYWEASEEKIQSREVEELGAGKQEAEGKAEHGDSRWWNKILPPSHLFWPRTAEPGGLSQRKCVGAGWDSDKDGEYSDYGTPPPSPTPSSSSAFRFFALAWNGVIVPEHYEICFNLLRHLFDLLVVGFLWIVSPPTKLVLEVLGVQGGLKLWLHGMAMFSVSTVGMAGLLWLVQEYLLQFALLYGIVQALVISVSIQQSVILGEGDEEYEKEVEDLIKQHDHYTGPPCAGDNKRPL
uniref:Si:ch73-25f10.6 n=1 Tax=Oncorhynchus kisutch TaxID=8019 RepID=A0A8C7MT81_ONCKI